MEESNGMSISDGLFVFLMMCIVAVACFIAGHEYTVMQHKIDRWEASKKLSQCNAMLAGELYARAPND